eukprot:2145135-Prymnesium_polylepis.1
MRRCAHRCLHSTHNRLLEGGAPLGVIHFPSHGLRQPRRWLDGRWPMVAPGGGIGRYARPAEPR